MPSPHLPRPWYSEFTTRLWHQWFFKSTGTALFTALFFYSYFALLRMPVFPMTIMPTTPVDDAISFWPPAFYIYASLWLYTALVPALQPNLVRLVGYGCGMGLLCLMALLIFLFFPSAVPFSATADWFKDPSMALLHKIDMPGNACPSLHVASALFSAICLHRIFREIHCPAWVLCVNWAWCTLIIYSTMGIKQHVMWDVVAGTMLAGVFGWVYPHFEKKLVEK
jgi:membrane-associated phospholipid phosphatase